ncbi:MAG: A24 family peptidase [Planctomycetota bacterium]|nr:A24 family peptidase [Planctomycetota bacterium]
MGYFFEQVLANWPVWFVTIALIVAAVIDGIQLKVPNWLTFPFIISGWIYSMMAYGMAGDGWLTGLGISLMGTFVGLALLLPAYSIGGMGAGDVKLLAGVGAWVHVQSTFYGFCLSAIVGAVLAVAMVLISRSWSKHKTQFFSILNEIMVIRNPETLAGIAAERKSSMMLLPYGIPIAIGCIMYFAIAGKLVA